MIDGSISSPIAVMMVSALRLYSEPSTGTGDLLPDSSGSPSFIFWHSSPDTLSFETITDFGATSNNWFGRSEFTDPYFNGSLDDFRVYRRALSQEEVVALMALR